ncbi:glycogen-binding subunit 76A [Cylas formicarius]|uniref:glycogen-binding subunit 76A n=1 Tax=Cylas formicarius TaxID=197179 RepID=UPI00295839D5|nr:glycogen-binding subunit 76A [Cylas formicarius]
MEIDEKFGPGLTRREWVPTELATSRRRFRPYYIDVRTTLQCPCCQSAVIVVENGRHRISTPFACVVAFFGLLGRNFESFRTFSDVFTRFQMTSEQNNCGLSSILPISCRDRAEAFARSLQSRLHSLGTQTSPSNERSWLGPQEKPITVSQPLHTLETERYLQLEALESPGSPQDEENEFHTLLNRDSLQNGCHCNLQSTPNGLPRNTSNDSDNEVFYDLDDESASQNGYGNSESSRSSESETGIDVNSQGTLSDAFCTSLDCTPQASLSDDVSTLSRNEDDSDKSDECLLKVIDSLEKSCRLNGSVDKSEEELLSVNGFRNGDCQDCGDAVESNDETDYVRQNGETDRPFVSTLSIDIHMSVECPQDNEEKCRENGEVYDEDQDDSATPRVRRCSSLKTGKTPPGTPGRKKIVRFADVLGLDLADVRTFLDEIPKVPKSAYDDLNDVDLISDSATDLTSLNPKYHGLKADKILVPMFDQPAGMPTFLELVRDNLVCLENAFVDDPVLFSIRGFVRVRNLDFHKSVHIRYTLDSWKTFADVQATYVSNSCDGFSDKFSFIVYAHTLKVGQRLEFACRFQCRGCQYWDNNNGRNYVFQCLPAANSATCPPITVHGHDDWGASFY